MSEADWILIAEDVGKVLGFLRRKLRRFTIVTGGAAGVDTLAEAFAMQHKLPRIVHTPDYEAEGVNPKAAPILRNSLIVADAEVMYAWPKRGHGGTDDAIAKMMAKAPERCHVRRPWEVRG